MKFILVTRFGRFRRRTWQWQPGQQARFQPWKDGHPWEAGDYGIPRDDSGRQYLIRELRLEVLERGSDLVPAFRRLL